jgi:nucleoside transporter
MTSRNKRHDLAMKLKVRIQLSIMMFLQFCVWGAWYGQLSKYLTNQLGATGDQVGQAYAAFSIAMVGAPFFIGMLADRYFAGQKVLGVLNLLGAAILVWITQINDPDFFFWVFLLYCLTFAPTIALTSSVALRHLKVPEKEFPGIRLFGTIAWIFITNVVGFMGIGDSVELFYLSIASAAAIGVFSFFLPDTPPTATEAPSFLRIIGKDAFVLFKDRSFLIFFISSVAICIPLSFYYTWANPSLTDSYIAAFPSADPNSFNVENKMSLGQASEVIFLLVLPLLYTRYGVKKILIIGLLAWIIRFIFFGVGDAGSSEWMFYIAILLHGVCFDFFFVTGMIYTDAKAGNRIKAQAQGLISLATYGIGMYLGSRAAGIVKDIYTTEDVANWFSIWMVPAGIAAVVLVLFIFFFHDNTKVKEA